MEQLFTIIDKNGDWALEKYECEAAIGKDGMVLIADMDTNEDGKVTIE